MAAGLTLNLENYEQFKKEVCDYFNNNFTEKDFVCEKYYDMQLTHKNVNIKFVKELERFEPFGCDNPKPVFMIEWEKSITKPMANYPQHISIILNGNVNLLAFNSSNYIQNIQYNKIKRALVELQLNVFNGKESIKCLVKNFSFEKYNKIGQDMLNGSHVKQVFVSGKNDVMVNYCEDIFENIKRCFSGSNFGNLIVCNHMENLEKLQTLLDGQIINYSFGKIQHKNAINTVVTCYSNVFFTEPVICKEYFGLFKGVIYVPKNERYSVKQLNLNLNRDYLLKIYGAIKNYSGKIHKENEFSYYQELKKLNSQIYYLTYAQFICTINIFNELGLIQIKNEIDYSITTVDCCRRQLEDSYFYNRLKQLTK